MVYFTHTEKGTEISVFFISEVLGKKVYTKDGEFLGKVTEIVAAIDYRYPEVQAFELSKGRKKFFLPIGSMDPVKLAATSRIVLEEDAAEFHPNERHFFVKDVLYDRQIVDVNGAKVERVNDIRILSRWGRFFIAHVDVGFTGLVRRLGFEAPVHKFFNLVGKELKDDLIDWRFVQPLPETYLGPLSVRLRQEEIKQLHAGELADILEELDRDDRLTLLQSIGAEDAAEALEETDIKVQTSILRDLDTEFAADILEEMEPAVAADVMEKLPSDTQESIMAAMEDEDRAIIEVLISAKEESAASLMTLDFIYCLDSHTVSQALALLRENAAEIESITYIYCTDEEMRLKGVVSLRNLILAEPGERLSDIMNKRLVTLSTEDDWNEVASQFMKLRFKALPVVDPDGKMLGIVTFLHSFDELLPYYYRLAA